MLQFFWTRTASIWIAVLYILLGLPLFLFPDASGKVFVWALAAGAAVYAISHLWRYFQSRKRGTPSGGDLFLTILPLAFALFSLTWPQAILSFLPLALGAMLLVDGAGKVPLVVDAIRVKLPILVPLLLSSVIPIALGILLVLNPFPIARLVMMVFGAALVADGISDLVTALMAQKHQPDAPGQAQPPHT